MKHKFFESKLQIQCVNFLKKFYPNLLFTGGFAGEKLTLLQAIRRKRMGYSPGTPDLIIFKANKNFHGLMIEFKSETGYQTKEQKEFQIRAEKEKYKYIIIKSLQQFISEIQNYLSN